MHNPNIQHTTLYKILVSNGEDPKVTVELLTELEYDFREHLREKSPVFLTAYHTEVIGCTHKEVLEFCEEITKENP
jgi:hypothetical protein